MPEARPYIGGQAVLEGVMMRSPHSLAVAVRRRSGRVEVRERPVRQTRTGPASWPLLRGMLSLVEALKLGTEALRWSSDVVGDSLADLRGTVAVHVDRSLVDSVRVFGE